MQNEIKFPFTLPPLPEGARWLTVSAVQWIGGSKNYYSYEHTVIFPLDISDELEVLFTQTCVERIDNVDLCYLNKDDSFGFFERITPQFLLP